MANPEMIRTMVGLIGNVISFCLFASPIPTFVQICKNKSVEQFKPDPYLATTLNCVLWVFYGIPIVHPDSILVATINGTGLAMEIAYVFIFFIYADFPKRGKIAVALLLEMAFMGLVMFITLRFFHTYKTRSALVGMLCVVFGVIMYASPLTVMREVIRTKSVKYMPFTLSLAIFANGVVWSIYACLRFDPYVLIPNGLGALSGMVQLGLYAVYYKSTLRDDREKPPEIQLPEGV